MESWEIMGRTGRAAGGLKSKNQSMRLSLKDLLRAELH